MRDPIIWGLTSLLRGYQGVERPMMKPEVLFKSASRQARTNRPITEGTKRTVMKLKRVRHKRPPLIYVMSDHHDGMTAIRKLNHELVSKCPARAV